MDNKLRNQENILFVEWLNTIENNQKFAKDGAGCQFSEQHIKIIFLAKETNNTSSKWDTREYLDNGVFYKSTQFTKNGRKEHTKGKAIGKTFNNIYRWANFLLNPIESYKEFENVPTSDAKRINVFSKITMMNLKKGTGAAVTDNEELSNAVKKDFSMIQKQLDLYINNEDLKIIFCCGNGVYKNFKQYFKLDKSNEKISLDKKHSIHIYNKNFIVIDFYHPQPRGIKNKSLYSFLVKIKTYCNI